MSIVRHPSSKPRKGQIPGLLKVAAAVVPLMVVLAMSAMTRPNTAGATGLERFEERERMAPQMGLPGKIAYCTYCHGSSGRGYYGFYVMPRLAGQSSEYIINQLHAFVSGRRDRSIAVRLATVHSIDPSEQSAVADHFASLRTASASDGPLGNVTAGSKLYNEGAPDSNVPASASCMPIRASSK
jgi:cytochrome c553